MPSKHLPRKSRVLHVCETIKGGIATYLETFDKLCTDDFESRYIVPRDHLDQSPQGADVIAYDRSRRGVRSVWQLARTSRDAALDFAPDLLLFHSTFSLGAMALLRAWGVPGVYAYIPHGWARLRYTEAPGKARLVSMVEGRLVGMSDLVLNISKNDKAIAEAEGYRGRHVVVENALAELERPPGPAPFDKVPGRIDLLFVGRFDRQKGLDILLDAFELALVRNPALHLHIVGANVQEKGGEAMVGGPNVTFHGWTAPEQVADYFAYADLCALPSRWEGLPMVLIEALRAGTPVMLADVSGMGELIGNSGSGIVVTPDIGGFEEALATLSADQARQMRPAARALFTSRYGPERFRAETREVLLAALKQV